MPLAVTHILVPIIGLELLKEYSSRASKFFHRKYTFLVGIAGLMPDMDLHLVRLVEYLGKPLPDTDLGHRILFHNLWVPIGFLLFFMLFYYVMPRYMKAKSKTGKAAKKRNARLKGFGKVFLVLCIGWTVHITLDAVLTGYVMPFYPLNDYLADYNLVGKLEAATGISMLTYLVSLDAALLFFWLWHEEAHHYIKDYF
jgi:membrane-bound metal-dependent hydrolase YbcI (DUF457 family)